MATSFQPPLLLLAACFLSHVFLLHALTRPEVESQYFQWVDRVGAAANSQQSLVTSSETIAQSELAARYITVNQQGTGNFKSVQDAVDSIPTVNSQRVIIQIAAGTYKEKVKITKKKAYITLQGDKTGPTVITWDDTAKKAGSTLKSATVAVMSDGFVASDITFVNTSPYPKPGSTDLQAVAFQISGDQAALYSCKFFSTQDTLYDHKGRHYFYGCFIQGSVDFIFGDGLSLYENCDLHAIAKSYGSFTAQKRKSASDDSGFSFVNCRMTGSGILYLSRAWGAYSRVVFITSYIDAQIAPGGFYNWGQSSRQKTVFYGTYKCSGPGANINSRVAWSHELTAAQAAPFMSLAFVGGNEWVTSAP